MAALKIYKIRHKITGLYQNGGMWLSWSKKGKVWNGIGPLKLHLNLFKDYRTGAMAPKCDIENWEVVLIEMTETDVCVLPADGFI